MQPWIMAVTISAPTWLTATNVAADQDTGSTWTCARAAVTTFANPFMLITVTSSVSPSDL